jgi:hypothetical protein
MIGGNNVIETERIEQLALIALQPPHHLQGPLLNVVSGRHHCSLSTATDFCNKIGTTLPYATDLMAGSFRNLPSSATGNAAKRRSAPSGSLL